MTLTRKLSMRLRKPTAEEAVALALLIVAALALLAEFVAWVSAAP